MTPYYEQDGIVIYHGRCEEVLSILPPVEHMITDPPYSEHVHGKSRAGSRVLPVDGSGNPQRCSFSREKEFGFEAMTEPLRRAVCEWAGESVSRWVLVFSDVESAHLWREQLAVSELEYIRTGAWVKVGSTPQFTGDRPAAGFETITISHPQGKKRWNGGGTHALWSVPIVLNRGGVQERVHTTQKPEALMAQLVTLFTDPGETIIDPFMGSGTTLVAAKRLGRKAIGIERKEEYCEVAAKRLRQGALDLFAS